MDTIILVSEMVVTILGMIFVCFFTSGIAIIPGSIFEKKSTPEERAAKAAEERGAVRGGEGRRFKVLYYQSRISVTFTSPF